MTDVLRRHWVRLGLTAAILVARISPAAPLSDPTGHALAEGIHLHYPPLYLILAPLFSLWDAVSMLTIPRLVAFLAGAAALYLGWRAAALARHRDWGRELRRLPIAILALGAFVFLGAVWHRPMASLTGVPPEMVVLDYHSHSSASHDVTGLMAGFDVAANRRWHARAGFDAFFLTDHNTVAALPGPLEARTAPTVCPGIEVSAWNSHIVMLGDTLPIAQSDYDGSPERLAALLRESRSRYGALAIASLPEYDRHLWDRRDMLVAAGVAGFEIVNASPKGNAFPRGRRDSIIALARAHGLALLGVSDSHGWGATSMVWNLMALPRWREDRGVLCGRILARLADDSPAANRIVERHRLRVDAWWPRWLTVVGVVWETWRAINWPLSLSWFAWLWLPLAVTRSRAGDARGGA